MTVRFFTHDGLEVPAVTAAQMREVDRIAVEETGPNLLQMMENAGRSLALEAISKLGGDWRTSRIVPSGMDATTGETPGEHLRASWTLTPVLPKTGLCPEHSGEVILADLGIPSEVFRRVGVSYQSPFAAQFRVSLRMVT